MAQEELDVHGIPKAELRAAWAEQVKAQTKPLARKCAFVF